MEFSFIFFFFFFTAMPLRDFQREFDIDGCVLMNRNIVVSEPNYEEKSLQIKICRKGFKRRFTTHYMLCKL